VTKVLETLQAVFIVIPGLFWLGATVLIAVKKLRRWCRKRNLIRKNA